MKGIELAKGYFCEECLPRLRREMPGVLPYLAAGLVGEGSDCFGYDDFLSRDHDWGPAFCLWLPERLMGEYAASIVSLLESMPGEYKGLKARKMKNEARVGLHSIGGFYSTLIGCAGVPESDDEWLAAPESGLAAAVNGVVFLDNLGEFSAVRTGLLAHYPENVRLWLLARRCALAAQTGQYNYARCLHHGEKLAAEVIKGRFIENAAGALFLLHRRYMPFYKWSYRALRELSPLCAGSVKMMEALADAEGAVAVELIERISAGIIAELKAQRLSDSPSDFLMDHCGNIMRHIDDDEIRRRGVTLSF